jgi:FlaA1/EpsC-like NDP-sugar epimerase
MQRFRRGRCSLPLKAKRAGPDKVTVLKSRRKLFALVERMSRAQKRFVLMLADVVLAPLALLFTFLLIYGPAHPLWTVPIFWASVPLIAVLAGITTVLFRIPRVKLNAYEGTAVMKTAGYSLVLMLALWSMNAATGFGMPVFGTVLYGLILFMLSVAARLAMLQVLTWVLRQGQTKRRVVIYGAGNTGTQLAAALRAHKSLVPVAFVDDNPALQTVTVAGLKVLSAARLEDFVRDRGVDRIVLAMPSLHAAKLGEITRHLRQLGLEVHSLPSFAQLVGEEKLIDHLGLLPPGEFLNRAAHGDSLPKEAEAYVGRSVLVTGAGGSVGSELCRQLLNSQPRKIVLFEVSEFALYTIEREMIELAQGSDIEICAVLGSVTDSRLARAVIADHAVDVVFHAAAYKHVPLVEMNPLAGLANNVLGTRTIADAASDSGVERFILISTDKAVRPTNVMGASKRLAELVVQDLAKRSEATVFSMVRFGNVLGSSGSVIPLFKEQIARGGPVTVTHDEVTRFFMTITEAARLVLLAGSFAEGEMSRGGGDVFVLDMGKPVRIRDLAVQMIHAAGRKVKDSANPDGEIEIVVTGLRPGEKLHEELLIGEGLLTTPHQKILRAREESLSELEMANALRALRTAVAAGDAEAGRAVVRRWVEGYQAPVQAAGSQ